MGVGFEFFLSKDAGFWCFLGSFILGDAVVLGRFICLTYTHVFSVSFWGVSCDVLKKMLFPTIGNHWGVSCDVFFRTSFPTLGNKNRFPRSYVVCLNISDKLLIACNFLAPMDENGTVGDRFAISSIKYSSVLVATYWLGIPGTFLCSGKKVTASTIMSTLFCWHILYSIYSVPWLVPNTTPLHHVGPNMFVLLVSYVSDLVQPKTSPSISLSGM